MLADGLLPIFESLLNSSKLRRQKPGNPAAASIGGVGFSMPARAAMPCLRTSLKVPDPGGR